MNRRKIGPHIASRKSRLIRTQRTVCPVQSKHISRANGETRFSRRQTGTASRNGADGIRTHDPLRARQVLSQLSYRPEDQVL